MKTGIGLAATLMLAVVLALELTGTAAAAENAVVHWSGVAEGVIAAGRPPASSSVLAGMVHGAMYDAVAAIEGGLSPFATSVTAPPGASADAAVAQAARDVLVARVPAQAAAVQTAYDAYMAAIPNSPAKDGGKAVGAAAPAGMLAMRTGDHFDDVVPYVQPFAATHEDRPTRADLDEVLGLLDPGQGEGVAAPLLDESLRQEDLRPSLIRRYLNRGIPIMTGLSATYLYQARRELSETSMPDDVRGQPVGHFVVLSGYDRDTRLVDVADPFQWNPLGGEWYYSVDQHRLIAAVLLGSLTYDANLLVIEQPRRRRWPR